MFERVIRPYHIDFSTIPVISRSTYFFHDLTSILGDGGAGGVRQQDCQASNCISRLCLKDCNCDTMGYFLRRTYGNVQTCLWQQDQVFKAQTWSFPKLYKVLFVTTSYS